jgi:hypothetical protein
MRLFKGSVIACVAFALLLSAATPAAASSTRRYGPIHSGSPDSGTCGFDWATDTFDRVFTADTTANTDGTYKVREDFINGSFITLTGPSPQACDAQHPTGGIVGPGIQGRMGGTFAIVVSNGAYTGAACSPVTCETTALFVATVYGPTAKYTIPTFFFGYATRCNGFWINASDNLGGNRGDISGVLHPCGSGDGGRD